MRYDLNKIPPGKTAVGFFPELAEFKEFKDKSKDKILRIAIWSTDEESPFVVKERDDYERLIRSICSHEKFTDEKVIESIVEMRNLDFNEMVNRYFIQCDNLAYVMWKDKFIMFHFIGLALRAPVDMKNMERDMAKRADLDLKREVLHKSLIEYEAQVFSNTFTRKIVRKEVAKIIQLAERFSEEKNVI